MKINLCTGIFGTSGYAVHGINLAKALINQGIDLGIEVPFYGAHDWKVPFPEEFKFSDFRENLEKNYQYENTLMITTPEWFDIKSGDRIPKFIVYGVFEGTKVNPKWAETCNKDYIYKVICPSEHTKQAFWKGTEGVAKEQFDKKYVVIPHGYNPNIFKPEGPKKYNDDIFRFLFVGGWKDGERDRKRVDILVKAFCAEFEPEENVELLLKFNMAYQYQDTILMNLTKLNLPTIRPKINLSFDNLTEEQLADVYRGCDCFVMPTMGESFCMPNLEALACGIPSLATDYGGQAEYLPKEYLIEVEKMVPSTGESWIYDWAEWAVPSQSHMQELMRKAFEGNIKPHPEIAKNFTWNNTAKKIIELFI